MSMQKQWLGAQWLFALLLAHAAGAQAHLTTWEFSYQGFVDDSTGLFDPGRRFSGLFTGRDSNSNGIITRDELVYLSAGGTTYIDPTGISCNRYDGAAGYSCRVDQFAYSLSGDLVFAGSHSVGAEMSVWTAWVITGEAHGDYGDTFGNYWNNRYAWTEQTTFAISPQPVPEPSIALLLPAGCAALWGLGRWQRRSRCLR